MPWPGQQEWSGPVRLDAALKVVDADSDKVYDGDVILHLAASRWARNTTERVSASSADGGRYPSPSSVASPAIQRVRKPLISRARRARRLRLRDPGRAGGCFGSRAGVGTTKRRLVSISPVASAALDAGAWPPMMRVIAAASPGILAVERTPAGRQALCRERAT